MDRKTAAADGKHTRKGSARRAARRLKPFKLGASAITLEARRGHDHARRAATLPAPTDDPDVVAASVRALAQPLVAEHAEAVRALLVRLSRLGPTGTQASLFPVTPAFSRAL